jgi:hypothetical protein
VAAICHRGAIPVNGVMSCIHFDHDKYELYLSCRL